jgi:hypothetical protein
MDEDRKATMKRMLTDFIAASITLRQQADGTVERPRPIFSHEVTRLGLEMFVEEEDARKKKLIQGGAHVK